MRKTKHVPVNESPLGVHEVELVVKPSPGLGDSGGIAQHANGALNFSQVTAGYNGGRLIVDSNLKGKIKQRLAHI